MKKFLLLFVLVCTTFAGAQSLSDPNLAAAQVSLQGAQSELDALNATIAQNAASIQNLNAQLSTSSATIATLQTQLSAAKQVFPSVVGGLHAQLPWGQNGNVGNSGGGSTAPHGTYTETLSQDGTYTVFAIVPSTGPTGKGYDNYYFSKKDIGAPSTAPHRLVYHQKFFFPVPTDETKCQAYEFELQWSDGTYTHNMAWQANLVAKPATWRYFHFTGTAGTGGWIDTGIPVDVATLQSGAPLDVYATFLADPAGTTTHESIQINGTKTVLNIVQPAVAGMSTSRYLRVANQLDSRGIATGQTVPPPYAIGFTADVQIFPAQ